MRKVLALLMLLGLPASARATWAHVPVEELVRESDLIVVGTLRGVEEHRAGETDYGQGRIEVREVIWGDTSPGASLRLKWDNRSGLICPRVEHRDNADEEGIWLLTRDGDAVAADYPGRFVELSERRKVEAALRNSPVVLRADRDELRPGEPMRLSVVYRNPSRAPRTFPGLAFEGGGLRISPGSRLAVSVTHDTEDVHALARLQGGVVRDPGLAPVAVPPRREHRVELDLRDMLAAEPVGRDWYHVTLKFDGLPPTNELDFYVGEPSSLRPEAPPPPSSTVECAYRFSAAERRGLTPAARAALAALAALLLFPVFHRLRATTRAARLTRVLQGMQTWQI